MKRQRFAVGFHGRNVIANGPWGEDYNSALIPIKGEAFMADPSAGNQIKLPHKHCRKKQNFICSG